MAKIKYSYAIVQSIFGNLWVGRSRNKSDGKHYFKTHQQAVDEAMLRFEDKMEYLIQMMNGMMMNY